METIRPGDVGPAVEDVQRRLAGLGYQLISEDETSGSQQDPSVETSGSQQDPSVEIPGVDGIYGDITASAVSAFRQDHGLEPGDTVDAMTWAALVDASFKLGDRTLYLRMPYFHGHDVGELQQILSTLGFSCGTHDSIFGAFTEKAVRDFQANMGIDSDGIVGMATYRAIERLHWAYKDKNPIGVDSGELMFARAAEVLENNPICIYGTDAITREIASRISNLAFATSKMSKLVSADSLSEPPTSTMTMIEIISSDLPDPVGAPVVVFDGPAELVTRFRIATAALSDKKEGRIVIKIDLDQGSRDDDDMDGNFGNIIQHYAIQILDAICYTF